MVPIVVFLTSHRITCRYGYVRGTYLKPQGKVHIPGLGDFFMRKVDHLKDPCPLPGASDVRAMYPCIIAFSTPIRPYIEQS